MVQQKDWGKQRGNKHLEMYFFCIFFWVVESRNNSVNITILQQRDSGRSSNDVTQEHATWTWTGLWFLLWEPLWDQRLRLHVSTLHMGLSTAHSSPPHARWASILLAVGPGAQSLSLPSVTGPPLLNSQGSFCAQVGLERTQSTNPPICKSLLLSK